MRTYSLFWFFAFCCILGCSPEIPDTSLFGLSVTGGTLSPAFSNATTMYSVQVPYLSNGMLQVTATAVNPSATILVNGIQVASGAASAPIPVGPGPTMIAVVVQAGGGVQKSYDLLVVRPPSHYIKASNAGAGDQFGRSMSLSGDTLAVGAFLESSNGTGVNSATQADNSAPESGAVYVFTRSGTVWSQQAYLKASNTDGNDQFGRVSLSGDTLAVGAHLEDSSGTGVNSATLANNSAVDSGAVYVYR